MTSKISDNIKSPALSNRFFLEGFSNVTSPLG